MKNPNDYLNRPSRTDILIADRAAASQRINGGFKIGAGSPPAMDYPDTPDDTLREQFDEQPQREK